MFPDEGFEYIFLSGHFTALNKLYEIMFSKLTTELEYRGELLHLVI